MYTSTLLQLSDLLDTLNTRVRLSRTGCTDTCLSEISKNCAGNSDTCRQGQTGRTQNGMTSKNNRLIIRSKRGNGQRVDSKCTNMAAQHCGFLMTSTSRLSRKTLLRCSRHDIRFESAVELWELRLHHRRHRRSG